ncbi:MAG: M61 family peptidase [Candidatus Acidiferrales bacterium]|jgi:predicted metalloprotease with PDZ domain
MIRRVSRLLLGFAMFAAMMAPGVLAQSDQAISLTVDASQAPLKIIRAHIVMPVKAGPLTLYYPKWIPGEHAPDGPIANLTGLKFSADGKTIPWDRDLLDVFTFHVDVPTGAEHLDISFDYLEPAGSGAYTAGASATDKLVVLSWNQFVLYPAGTFVERLSYETKLILPQGWKFGTPLEIANQSGNQVSFKPVPLNRLVDSPVVAGEYYRVLDITPPGEPIHHEIDIVADSEAALNMSPEVQQGMVNLVAESGKLFGTRHYRDYHFLLTLSDHVAHFGLEHHESNDSRLPERVLLGPDAGYSVGGLLAHEFVHSWNGKFRRPADLSTPYYEVPMKTDLLWVYEGLTDYLGPMLAARSGLWTPAQYHEVIAGISASLGPGRPGRTWRPLLDTAVAEPGLGFARGWFNWRRGTDYYDEGDLIWLEVATIINRESHGQKSIDDFCHLFHGGTNDGPQLKTYTFEELLSALNSIAPYDWAGYFHEKLTSTSPDAPVGGIENGGWKVVYTDQPSKLPGRRGGAGDAYSIGLQVGDDGQVSDSIVGSPAYKAGITSGMKVAAVNGRVYTQELLEDAIKDSKDAANPIVLLVIVDDYYKAAAIDYHGGQRYPHLVRDETKPDYLDDLIKAHAGK